MINVLSKTVLINILWTWNERIVSAKHQRVRSRTRKPFGSKGHSITSSQICSACRSKFQLYVGNARHTWSMLLFHRLSSRGKKTRVHRVALNGAHPALTLCSQCVLDAEHVQLVNRVLSRLQGELRALVQAGSAKLMYTVKCKQHQRTSWCPQVCDSISSCLHCHSVSALITYSTTWPALSDWLANGTFYLLLYGWE